MTAPADMQSLLAANEVMVVCGSGGVGKTTTAAALAMQAALHTDRRVLVLTVDPARRLADALGIRQLGNEATRVRLDGISGVVPKGQMFAAMLDAKRSWDDLVQRHAPDRTTAHSILANPLYRNITGRFVQSHDYIAMERLYELHRSGDYDLIIIDTPPAAHAIDFLEAPARMADFFDSKFLKFLIAPSRSLFTNLASRPFLQVADRILGKRFLSDITEFFGLLESMRPGFIQRAEDVEKVLHGDRTSFVVVTTLEPAPRREAAGFVTELRRRRLQLGAMVLNRVLPDVLLDAGAAEAAAALRAQRRELAERFAGEPTEQKKVERVLNELTANFDRFARLASYEQTEEKALAADATVVARVPWLGEEMKDLDGLVRLGDTMWK